MWVVLCVFTFEYLVLAGSIVYSSLYITTLASQALLRKIGYCQWGLPVQYPAPVSSCSCFPAMDTMWIASLSHSFLVPSFPTMIGCTLLSVSQVTVFLPSSLIQEFIKSLPQAKIINHFMFSCCGGDTSEVNRKVHQIVMCSYMPSSLLCVTICHQVWNVEKKIDTFLDFQLVYSLLGKKSSPPLSFPRLPVVLYIGLRPQGLVPI